jgi:hypothetical protein
MQKLLITASLIAGASACSGSSGPISGVRADGVTVECAPQFDDVSTCIPTSGDGTCDNGGADAVLWPPNHKLIRFTLADCAPIQTGCGGGDGGGSGGGDGGGSGGGDGGGSGGGSGSGSGSGSGGGSGGGGVILFTSQVPADARITSLTSDEPVEVGAGGDGHTTTYDMAIIDDVTFDLRSERQGGGDGRVYRVNYVDGAGVTGACEFVVPHDQGPTKGAVDSGTAVTIDR